MWGGADDRASLAAIRQALDLGINLIDTAPIYGHGHAESLVGQALRDFGRRDSVIVATKVGLDWDSQKTKVWRNSSPARIQSEIEASLRRLGTDYIDVYQVHWPDPSHPFEKTMEALVTLQGQGTIRFIGVSNFTVPQMERCLAVGPVHTAQPPYNLFERGSEADVLPFCKKHNIGTLVYGAICRGLLSGKYTGEEQFPQGDIRAVDPKFQPPAFRTYADCVSALKRIAQSYDKTVAQLTIRWCLEQPGVHVALCGARTPEQVQELAGAAGWALRDSGVKQIEETVADMVSSPVGPEFMSPP